MVLSYHLICFYDSRIYPFIFKRVSFRSAFLINFSRSSSIRTLLNLLSRNCHMVFFSHLCIFTLVFVISLSLSLAHLSHSYAGYRIPKYIFSSSSSLREISVRLKEKREET